MTVDCEARLQAELGLMRSRREALFW